MDKALAESIGRAARKARRSLKLTQEDTAERIGVSAEFYARIERGHALPSVPTLVRICAALGVRPDILLNQSIVVAGDGIGADTKSELEAPVSADAPEIRRVIRRLRKASPDALRLVTMVLKEVERHNR